MSKQPKHYEWPKHNLTLKHPDTALLTLWEIYCGTLITVVPDDTNLYRRAITWRNYVVSCWKRSTVPSLNDLEDWLRSGCSY